MFGTLYNIIFGPLILLLVIFFLYCIPYNILINFLIKDKVAIKKNVFYAFMFIPIAVWLSMYLLANNINLPFRKTFGNVFYEPIILAICIAIVVWHSLRKQLLFNYKWFFKNILLAIFISILIFLFFPPIGKGV